ncbi:MULTISPECIES: ATP-dependent DNA helicase [Streptomyces]|uniref:DNA 3'-5' helicase n=1 Tax=Streptomyces bottropensis ATCC 25435 TaxID=1054862 RepID=M3FTU4_9ACTN|nr:MULTISPECIES: ATP-dependent DNA helicase [Streptomyces]EMF55654.1 superfamily I DNA and RNA helicase [Streptomyces bottropensis ATCC 25435]MZD16218.1 UvrD-helicase domain-containing protein [Streptomyces sp. SID5476]
MLFTDAQHTAINTHDDNLLIVACAGSGKTEVISQRIAGLIGRPGMQPKNIVAFTFTEKAAGELKERVHTRIRELHGEVHGLAEMYIGTMHGYALDLLHSHVPEAFKYNVLNDVQTRLFIDKYSKQSGLTTTNAVVNGTTKPLRRYINSKLYQQVMSILREDDVDMDGLRPDVADGLDKYMQVLRDRSYFDYTAILHYAAVLLNDDNDEGNESVLSLQRHIKETVKYVVVDEYQDTNPVQEQLIHGLTRHGANLCVVGDDDQTIYQWRGSAVENILTIEGRYPNVHRVTLNENFRSSSAIVDLARHVVEQIPPGERLNKAMTAAGHQTFERGDLLALEFPDTEAEATWLVDRMERLRGVPFQDREGSEPRGLDWSDFAVLFRSVKADAGPLVEELRLRGIPYVIKGLTKLFETPEVQASVTCFRFVAGLADEQDVIDAWVDAGVGLAESDVRAGLPVLTAAMQWDASKSWDSTTLQGVFLEFLEAVELREERVPNERGELVYYNLGRFSTAIGDFERIHLTSEPQQRFDAFAKWVEHQAPDYYEESDGDNGYAQPNAVVIATVHQAKGMQWPAVFLPALRKNTFPASGRGGLGVFHVVEEALIPGAARYRGTEADERRLFYVAVTRAQKCLALSFAPNGKRNGKKRSDFFNEATGVHTVLTREVVPSPDGRLTPTPRRGTPEVVMSFSDLKYLFECPYSFKLRLLYGFDSPLQKELGFGKSLHDVMAEIHKRAIEGDIATPGEAEDLVDRHLNLPFANKAAADQLRPAAETAVRRYLERHGASLHQTRYSEQPVEIHPVPGVTVTGRVDLIKRLDTNETSVVDFKSSERAQAEDLTRDQLHLYVLGYRELTGQDADVVEVLNLDKAGRDTRELVDPKVMTDLGNRVTEAADSLRTNRMSRLDRWCSSCATCDFAGICRSRES